MIEIYGLTPIQRELAEIMWSMDSEEAVVTWMNSLPTKRLRAQAYSIYTLILIEAIDEEFDPEDMCLAEAVIESVK
jgi:hypothetical protein